MMDKLVINRRDSIILAAIDEIEECGIQAVSTKEIAKKLGISESIIFKHFSKKSDLLISVFEHFSQYDDAIHQTAIIKDMTPRDSILYAIESTSIYYQGYPAISSLVNLYEVPKAYSELRDKVMLIKNRRKEFIQGQIEKGINPDTAKGYTCIKYLSDIIMGTFKEICAVWRTSNYNFDLRDREVSAAKAILDAFGFQSQERF